MEQALLELLHQDLNSLGIELAPGADVLLLKYLEKVLETNQVMNLTAITDPVEAVHKHLIDSLSVLLLKSLLPKDGQSALWTDIGSGAGFPGIVLALAVPSATLHLVESTTKKAHFLTIVSAELGLMKRVVVHNQRAELLTPWTSESKGSKNVPHGTKPLTQERAPSVPHGTPMNVRSLSDAVFFRGVSKLASLVELGAPFLKMNGFLIAYKGPKAQEELLEATKAMKELKLNLVECRTFTLPGTSETRNLVCLQKTGETPKRFPRLVSLAQKEPLI